MCNRLGMSDEIILGRRACQFQLGSRKVRVWGRGFRLKVGHVPKEYSTVCIWEARDIS